MAMIRRFGFFILLNLAVIVTLSIIASFFGLNRYQTAYGINYTQLIGFCLVWGMGGAFISLLISKWVAKWSMGVKVIDPNTRDPQTRELVETVHRLARTAGLRKMPEVGIYESPEINAFATGPTRNNSLVAVSSGLLRTMDKNSVEGVLGHEVAHIANGDMVTMTLLQGVVNAFVMALARVVAFAISNALRGDRDERGGGMSGLVNFALVFVLEIVFMLAGSVVIAWFSRQREFRADQGGARFAGRDKMIGALRSLQANSAINMSVQPQENSAAVASLKISASRGGRLSNLFSTHPSLDLRIRRLERGTI